MRILVTNDDGIQADGVWSLVKALKKKFDQIILVAPDRERSAIGTAVTLRKPLKVEKVIPRVPGVEAFSVDGTPSDCVIIAATKLISEKIDLVVSGINHGPNVGDDVLISGTVGGALQGYLHRLPAMAISVDSWDNPTFEVAGELAALLAQRFQSQEVHPRLFLNVNVPNLPLSEIKGLEITRLSYLSHTHTVKEEDNNKEGYYHLLRARISTPAEPKTDVWAIEQGMISITPLRINIMTRRFPFIPHRFFADLLKELHKLQSSSV